MLVHILIFSMIQNSLQHGVNRWIREIRKVTRLDREPSSGTALQVFQSLLILKSKYNLAKKQNKTK